MSRICIKFAEKCQINQKSNKNFRSLTPKKQKNLRKVHKYAKILSRF